jgi:hypothetical protein
MAMVEWIADNGCRVTIDESKRIEDTFLFTMGSNWRKVQKWKSKDTKMVTKN